SANWQFSNVLPISTGRAVDAARALQSISTTDTTAPGPITNFTAQISDLFPSYSLNWIAPGDDGNGGGKVTAYEVRFSETSFTEANWELARPLPGPLPNDPGSFQFETVKIPWRHPSGFIGVRAVDDAGNRGPFTSLPISVSADTGDPYTIAEAPGAPLST